MSWRGMTIAPREVGTTIDGSCVEPPSDNRLVSRVMVREEDAPPTRLHQADPRAALRGKGCEAGRSCRHLLPGLRRARLARRRAFATAREYWRVRVRATARRSRSSPGHHPLR